MRNHDLRSETVNLIVSPHDRRRVTITVPGAKPREDYVVNLPNYLAKALRLRASVNVTWYPDEATWGDIVD